MAKQRYHFLDSLRGLILISMVLYHFTWDLVNLCDMPWDWFRSGLARIWQQSIAWSFILLSGFCWSFGQKKWKRGITVSLGGLIITAVTLIFIPSQRVVFGVLTFLGAAMLAMIPLNKLLCRCNPMAGLLCSSALFVLFRNVREGYLGFAQWNFIALPKAWYANTVTAFFGFPPDDFVSKDHFPFLPWFFLFCTGYFLHKLVQQHGWMDILRHGNCVPLEWLGRHSLIIYMTHQPILYAICMVLF